MLQDMFNTKVHLRLCAPAIYPKDFKQTKTSSCCTMLEEYACALRMWIKELSHCFLETSVLSKHKQTY